jgi:nucleotide-binding universal stress UspA family protein
MERILAVVDPSPEGLRLLAEAGTVAERAGVPLVVLALATGGSDEKKVERMREMAGVDDVAPGGPDAKQTIAQRFCEYAAERALGDTSVEYRLVGAYNKNRPSDEIIEIAEGRGCDYIYVLNTSSSPAGKALFGDTTQAVILNFDGYVTVHTR